MFPRLQVIYIVLVAVCLPLKTHAVVWLIVRVAWFLFKTPRKVTYHPFDTIPNVKRHIKHFTHLFGVNAFVSYCLFTYIGIAANEQHAKEVNRFEALKGDNLVSDNLHNFMGRSLVNDAQKYVVYNYKTSCVKSVNRICRHPKRLPIPILCYRTGSAPSTSE